MHGQNNPKQFQRRAGEQSIVHSRLCAYCNKTHDIPIWGGLWWCYILSAVVLVLSLSWSPPVHADNDIVPIREQQKTLVHKESLSRSEIADLGYEVRIGILAKRGKKTTLQRWRPLSRYLEQRIVSHDFTIIPLSFDELGPAVRDHDIDFVVTNSSFYITLERQYGISRITTMRNRVAGGSILSDFGGVIFTRRDRNDIQALSDLSGKHLIAVDERSFGGWQMAWLEMQENGFNPRKELERLSFAGTHDGVVQAVLTGRADAGTVRTDTLEQMQDEGKIKLDEIKVINDKHYIGFPLLASTALYPEWPFARIRGTPDSLVHEVALALMAMSAIPEAKKCCGIDGWTVPGDYSLVDNALRILRVGPYEALGQFTLRDVLERYWYWWIFAIVVMVTVMIRIIYLRHIHELTLRENEALEELIQLRNKELETADQLKQINIRLTASEMGLKNAEKLATLGHWELNLITNELLWSDEIYRIFEIDPNHFDASYDAFLELVHPDDREAVKQVYIDSLRTMQPYDIEHRLLMKGGRVKHVREVCDIQFNKTGKPLFSMGTLQDITELVKVEEKLRQAKEEAEAANHAKSIFLANMSHELRTPLNAILGFSQMMQSNPVIPATEQKYLTIINRSGNHLLQLINDVLDMSRIEAGRVQLELQDFDLGELIRDTIDMMHIKAEEKGLRLILDQSSNFPRFICGDQAKLRQILINLLGNSVKFTYSGGVTLRLDAEKDGNGGFLLRGEVQDTGIGIKPEDIERIFQPFEQLVESVTQKGTGLGLTITRQFVELMQGEIGIESTPGEGSLFHFKVRVDRAKGDRVVKETVARHQVIGLAPGQPDYRILIVEDQLENQLLLSHLLKQVGFKVCVAENGKVALEQFQQWQPHFIWMDRRMPVMDGLTATRAIRKLPGGDKVIIAALTASVFSEQREEVMAAGSDDFISKPYRPEEVFDCMARHLDLHYQYREPEAAQEEKAAIAVPLDAAALTVLPGIFLEELMEIVEAGDGVEARTLINTLAEEYDAVGGTLTHMVDDFHFDLLVALIKTALQERK